MSNYTAEDFRAQQSNLFHTFESINELIMRHPDEAILISITANTVLEVLARQEEAKKTSFELRHDEAERNLLNGGE